MMPPQTAVRRGTFARRSGLRTAAFDPDSISGLAIWLDANEGVTITSSPDVDSWTDKKNGYVFSQATAAKKPHFVASAQNGKPGIDFDGTDDCLTHAAAILSGVNGAIFCAYKLDSIAPSYQTLFGFADTGAAGNYVALQPDNADADNTSGCIAQSDGGGANRIDSKVAPDTNAHVLVGSSNGTSYRVRLDGYDVNENVSGANNGDWAGDLTGADTAAVGALVRNVVGSYLNGKILEILVYDGVTLTSDEIRDVEEGYLNDKYAIYTALSETPRGIAGLHAWYEAASGIALNSTTVKAWADQSDSGRDLTQTTAANQPLYTSSNGDFNSKPTVDFDGTNDSMKTAAWTAITEPNTIILVAKINTLPGSGNNTIMDGLGASNRHQFTVRNTGTTYGIYQGTTVRTGGTSDTSLHIFVMRYQVATDQLYIDGGAASINADSGSHSLTGITLGTWYAANADWADIDVAELLVYDAGLTAAQLNTLGNELATKYSTTWTTIT